MNLPNGAGYHEYEDVSEVEEERVALTKLQEDLFNVAKDHGWTEWNQVRDYAYPHKKYDNLTLRDIDEVVAKLNQ